MNGLDKTLSIFPKARVYIDKSLLEKHGGALWI